LDRLPILLKDRLRVVEVASFHSDTAGFPAGSVRNLEIESETDGFGVYSDRPIVAVHLSPPSNCFSHFRFTIWIFVGRDYGSFCYRGPPAAARAISIKDRDPEGRGIRGQQQRIARQLFHESPVFLEDILSVLKVRRFHSNAALFGSGAVPSLKVKIETDGVRVDIFALHSIFPPKLEALFKFVNSVFGRRDCGAFPNAPLVCSAWHRPATSFFGAVMPALHDVSVWSRGATRQASIWMPKCSPAADKIFTMWERAKAGHEVAGNDFAEFFLMVVERRVPSNLAALTGRCSTTVGWWTLRAISALAQARAKPIESWTLNLFAEERDS
jgi:hypothetical protein